jgi:DNA-binding XRE family transcriptional regulator
MHTSGVRFSANPADELQITFIMSQQSPSRRRNARKNFRYVLWRCSAVIAWVLDVPSLPRHRQNLGKRIRLYRKLSRLTQESLAEQAELAPSYVSDVERGRVNISVDAVQRIAKALRINLRDLFE